MSSSAFGSEGLRRWGSRWGKVPKTRMDSFFLQNYSPVLVRWQTVAVSRLAMKATQLPLYATRPAPHGASRLVQAMSTWSVKKRRARPRHCRDARIYGHTTTTMHGKEYPPHPLPPTSVVVGFTNSLSKVGCGFSPVCQLCKESNVHNQICSTRGARQKKRQRHHRTPPHTIQYSS